MTLNWVSGYLATIDIGGDDFTVVGNVLSLDGAKTVPRKPVFGAVAQDAISGQKTWTLAASGHVAEEAPVAELFALFAQEIPVEFTIQIGEAAGATDVGTMTGELVVSAMTISDDAEDEWSWSLTAEVNGDVDFTPPA